MSAAPTHPAHGRPVAFPLPFPFIEGAPVQVESYGSPLFSFAWAHPWVGPPAESLAEAPEDVEVVEVDDVLELDELDLLVFPVDLVVVEVLEDVD